MKTAEHRSGHDVVALANPMAPDSAKCFLGNLAARSSSAYSALTIRRASATALTVRSGPCDTVSGRSARLLIARQPNGRFHEPTRTRRVMAAVMLALAASVAASAGLRAQRNPSSPIAIGTTDLAGVVTSASGPEAGVWVIAETTDLPTKFAKIVVTDDRGRYVIPGAAESDLQRLGARLRPRRLAEVKARPAHISI